VWDTLGRVDRLKAEHRPGRYQRLCNAAFAEPPPPPEAPATPGSPEAAAAAAARRRADDFEAIEKDLGRTFPRHRMFSRLNGLEDADLRKSKANGGGGGGGDGISSGVGEHGESVGMARLRRVLRAYALYDPEVGYCQGMSFFVAMFLMYRPPPPGLTAAAIAGGGEGAGEDPGEERAFWQLVGAMWRPGPSQLRPLYTADMHSIRAHMHGLGLLAASTAVCPRASEHMAAEGIEISMFATPWYMTVFSSGFPFDLVTRVWDVFLAEGFKVLHRVALALLKRFEADIVARPFEELVGFLSREMPNLVDPDEIMELAFKIQLKQSMVDAAEGEYWAKNSGRR